MKSLLIFLPNKLYKEKPGYLFGKVIYDENTRVKKFYVIGVCELADDDDDQFDIAKCGNIIGYYFGNRSNSTKPGLECEYTDCDKKIYSDWIDVYLNQRTRNIYDYNLKGITVDNKKISSLQCQTIIIVIVTIYDQSALRKTELYLQKKVAATASRDHFHELMRIIQDKEVEKEIELYKKKKKKEKGNFSCIKETMLVYHMLLYFYPVLLLGSVTTKLLPILKYSFLGVHVNGWLENIKWMLITVIRKKKFTLKTGNYATALIIDMLLGIFMLQFLLHHIECCSPSQILLNNAEKLVTCLKDLINWLMGAPAGLKLNPALNNMLGKFFLYHIHMWWTFLIFTKPLMDLAFKVLVLFGKLGITFQIAIAADLLALVSFHAYCIYVYAARLFNIQLKGITSLFRLFLGKKKNPLRRRVDSCLYQPDQLFVGTLLFTILLFLMPTTWVYYAVFTMVRYIGRYRRRSNKKVMSIQNTYCAHTCISCLLQDVRKLSLYGSVRAETDLIIIDLPFPCALHFQLRLALISFEGLLTRMKFYLEVMPVYTFLKWLFQSHSMRSVINIKMLRAEGPIISVAMTIVVASWNRTWNKCIPDTITHHPSIEWRKITNNIIWGELLYPL